MLLAPLLCAGCTTVSVDPTISDLPPCSEYVPDEIKQDTPHAAPPASNDDAAWVGFAVAEAGQLEKSNVDRRTERQIIRRCEEARAAAIERSRKRAKAWWDIF